MDEIDAQKLLKKGAEAYLFLKSWHGRKVVVKIRFPKKYRPAKLDAKIRNYRTVHEPRLMYEAKKAGVPTPTIFLVDLEKAAITMEFVDGKQLKEVFPHIPKKKRRKLIEQVYHQY